MNIQFTSTHLLSTYYVLSDEAFGVEKHNAWEEESCDNGGHIVRGKLCSVGRGIVVTQKSKWP